MVNPFKHNVNLIKRSYTYIDDNFGKVSIGEVEVIVPNHSFWHKFAKGWEPETEHVFQSFIKSGSTCLDIGAWIGPTILFSLAYGAEKIVAVEPNPQSYSVLKKTIELNPHIADKVTLVNLAVSADTGTIKMGLDEDESDTSMFGINKKGIEIQTTTVTGLIEDHQLNQINLIKIDIEGAESLLVNDLIALGKVSNQCIHLSIHVPFFPDSADKHTFAQCFEHFDIYDDRGEQLSHQMLRQRLLSDQPHPKWGTRHGNYFELLLIAS